VKQDDDDSSEKNPTLRKAVIKNFDSGCEGKVFRVKVRVFNREGYSDSPYLNIINSGRPSDLQKQIIILNRNATNLRV